MTQIYYLDLPTLIDTLRGQSATLEANLPSNFSGLNGPGRGLVRLQEGRITECIILGRNGPLASGDIALRRLRAISIWQVTFMDQFPTPSLPLTPPPFPATPPQALPGTSQTGPLGATTDYLPQDVLIIPRLLKQPDIGYVSSLGMKERLVLRLVLSQIDGLRSVQQIKELLSLAPETVDRALQSLKDAGLVTW